MSGKKDNQLKFFAVMIFIFFIMLALNYLMPLHRDDYDYSMIWKTGEHINSLADVFDSTYKHYFLHGGRFFTVFCLDLFLWLGKIYFDVANALMFTILVPLIYFHATRSFKFENDFKIFAATGLMAWLSFPHFGEVAIWKSGSTVYLWSAVPAAIFLLPYNFFLANNFPKNISDKKIFAPIIFLLGIISGGGVENLGVTVTLLTLAISYHCYKKNILQSWMPAGFFGSLIGLIILLAAPGNFVRYDDQSVGKGFFAHIGNQIAGNAEMILYILPVSLILFCAVKILQTSSTKIVALKNFTFQKSSAVILIIAGIFAVSYFSDSFITKHLRDFFVENIFSNFNASTKFLERFDNFMMKSEEMIIYWLIIFAIFIPLKNSLGLNFGKKISFAEVTKKFPQVRFSLFLFALGIFNNLVMIGAPTFPARATFSSVVMFLIGTVVIFKIKIVREKLSAGITGRILRKGALAIGIFTILSAVTITGNLKAENDWRIEEIKKASAENLSEVTFPPIEIKNRALRHVFFVDFDNGVTVDGLCEFYKIKKISVTEK